MTTAAKSSSAPYKIRCTGWKPRATGPVDAIAPDLENVLIVGGAGNDHLHDTGTEVVTGTATVIANVTVITQRVVTTGMLGKGLGVAGKENETIVIAAERKAE